MTTVPLPDVPCVRIRWIFNEGAIAECGFRLYFSYTGSAPSAGNCATLATTCASAWNAELSGLTRSAFVLNEVDVLDIATNSGLSGQWNGSHAGTMTGAAVPANCAVNVEFGIARRYRGGKPRAFMPPGDQTTLTNEVSWSNTTISNWNTNMPIFISSCVTSPPGAMGTLAHVNLSYFSGFTNHTNTSGRERAVPTYRATAQHDVVTGYFAKQIVGSQRRRLRSTTP